MQRHHASPRGNPESDRRARNHTIGRRGYKDGVSRNCAWENYLLRWLQLPCRQGLLFASDMAADPRPPHAPWLSRILVLPWPFGGPATPCAKQMLKIDVLGPAVHAEVAASSTMTRASIKMWGDARMADAELQNLGKSVDAPHHHLCRPKMG